MEKINGILTNKIILLEKRVDLLEKQDNIKNERIAQLTDTVVNVQRALNSIDAKERARNVIVSGLTEEDIVIDEMTLSGDTEKMMYIFGKIGIDKRFLNNPAVLQRIGRDSNGEKRRYLKIVLKDYETRETVIKNAPKLKNLGEPINKIYINRDTHPVYQKEHQRLRMKFNELKRRQDIDPESVKLLKGVLMVNDITVDRNVFLK